MSVADAFNRHAAEYDALRRKFIPCFDDFYGTAVDLLDREPASVLDLGAGTGLMAGFVKTRFPKVKLTLVDVADSMLDGARARFADAGDVEFRVADYQNGDLGGPYDVVVSALSIHHLEHDAKRDLFRRVRGVLKPGGRFVNADQAGGPTEAVTRRDREVWIEQVRALGITDEQWAEAVERQKHDRFAPLSAQLAWLGEAGFSDVHAAYKFWSFVVYTGIVPEV